MADYNYDEMRRRDKKNKDTQLRIRNSGADYDGMLGQTDTQELKIKSTPTLGKEEEPWTAINIEVRDGDFMRIAQEAHRRDITINKMVNIILKDSIKNAEYRFEHESKPQVLKEY